MNCGACVSDLLVAGHFRIDTGVTPLKCIILSIPQSLEPLLGRNMVRDCLKDLQDLESIKHLIGLIRAFGVNGNNDVVHESKSICYLSSGTLLQA